MLPLVLHLVRLLPLVLHLMRKMVLLLLSLHATLRVGPHAARDSTVLREKPVISPLPSGAVLSLSLRRRLCLYVLHGVAPGG